MYDCINEAIQWVEKQNPKKIKNTDDIDSQEVKLVKILIRQYYYGIQAKKELYYKMIELGGINNSITNK